MAHSEKKYLYIAYGLTIQSEIEFPELFILNTDNKIFDIYILIGVTPKKNSIIGFQKPISAYNKNEFWQEIPNIARYYAKNGNKVIIEPLCENWQDIRLFFISNVFITLLFQNELVPIRASGILDSKGDVVLFVGGRMTGKSTLVFQLINEGYKLFTDDCIVADLSINNGSPFVFGLAKNIKIWETTLEDIDTKNIYERYPIRLNSQKKIVLCGVEKELGSKILTKIVFISERLNDLKVDLIRIDESDGFAKLHKEVHYLEFIENLKLFKTNFTNLLNLSRNIDFYILNRPFQKKSFEEVKNKIVELL